MKLFTHLIILSLTVFGAQTSSAALLTFDDIPGINDSYPDGQNALGQMPAYKGFSFSSTLYWVDVVGSGSNYGAYSGDFALSNQQSGTGLIIEASATDFTFGGLWAKKWGTLPDSGDDKPPSLTEGTLSGYKDDILVWQVQHTSLNGDYKFYGPEAGLIDELRLGFGNNFLVDDITLNAVPVPAAVWLFVSGLIGLFAMTRRKIQA